MTNSEENEIRRVIADRLSERFPSVQIKVSVDVGAMPGGQLHFEWDELNENITESDILKAIEGLVLQGEQIISRLGLT